MSFGRHTLTKANDLLVGRRRRVNNLFQPFPVEWTPPHLLATRSDRPRLPLSECVPLLKISANVYWLNAQHEILTTPIDSLLPQLTR